MKKQKKYWNYRILVHKEPNEDLIFAIHEVYYENNKPVGYTGNPIAAQGESIEEVVHILQTMLSDVKSQPILWADEKFPQEYA